MWECAVIRIWGCTITKWVGSNYISHDIDLETHFISFNCIFSADLAGFLLLLSYSSQSAKFSNKELSLPKSNNLCFIVSGSVSLLYIVKAKFTSYKVSSPCLFWTYIYLVCHLSVIFVNRTEESLECDFCEIQSVWNFQYSQGPQYIVQLNNRACD